MTWTMLMISLYSQVPESRCKLKLTDWSGMQSQPANINTSKTKVMRINASNTQAAGEEIEDVNSLIYLGGTVKNEGGTTKDIKRRLGHARSPYNKLTAIWNSLQIGRKTKIRLFNSNVISVLLYGSETWKMTKGDEYLLDTFLHKSLRRILKVYLPQRVRNETVRERAGMEPISSMIKKRRWKWIGHVLRMDKTKHARVALTWTPEGKRRRGRPKETWRRTVERESSRAKDRMERTCSWPYSPQREKEISQVSHLLYLD